MKTINSIAFVDTEIEPNSRRILDIGSIKSDGNSFHKTSVADFIHFLKDTEYVCGHNITKHDIKFIGHAVNEAGINPSNIIDTLFLSPLLFPSHPYHALLKDDKLQTEEMNNPLNDSIKAKDLFFDEVAAFQQLNDPLKQIYYLLLNDINEFHSFFSYQDYLSTDLNVEKLIRDEFKNEICENAELSKMIQNNPVELAYCLSLIKAKNRYSITPPWVLKNYPLVEQIMFRLRNKPCLSGCAYCDQALDIHKGLQKYFGFNSFRTFAGEPLQEKAVKAAVDNKSILAVFPTGGGKSITFQIPALMSGENTKGLTVVISPLQSLMKDQVDNLEKNKITEAVTINGLLDPIERAKSIERIEEGLASILYIAPESLRSRTIEQLLLGRKIARFVIDEAHCFSSWGQDFRVDYLYIADFIKSIQEKKNLDDGIPVSCFTATAKQKVIEDIRNYFKQKLSLDLELFTSKATRTNLLYKVFEKECEEEKYQAVRNLIEENNCPTIIYVSKTRKARNLAERLTSDGFNAKPYHGKMEVKEKTANQHAFISGEIPIMVATSAFGMGVDKKDVGMVIHYEISNSLENYIQEAGRAGRDENIFADCFVLFNEEDLNKHFVLLNQSKLSIKEIQQVWKAVKEITKYRLKVSNSALEIAIKAGWDQRVVDMETRVATAIAALEEAGYLKRGQNMAKIFANSILSKNAQEAVDKINASDKFDLKQKEKAIRIIKKLFSSKSRKQATDEAAETRIDYISEHLGIVKEEVIRIINLLREEKILADTKDLSAFIKYGESKNRSLRIVETIKSIENFLLPQVEERKITFSIKELNEKAEEEGCEYVTPSKIKTILNFWAIKNWIKLKNVEYSKNHIVVLALHPRDFLREKLEKRHGLAKFIVEYLFEKSTHNLTEDNADKEEVLIEFSVQELKDEFEKHNKLFVLKVTFDDIEDTLFYLSRIDAIKIEGGFMVIYNRLTIEKLEHDNKKRYKLEDYQKLNQFYENRIQQIHIVGEYAKKMLNDYESALKFVEDYFQLNYPTFLNKYFKGSRQNEIQRTLTPSKFKQLFGELSPTQLRIINDKESKYIVVAAGPGSGKTRVLVHKLASLLLMEDVKHEQMLMLTFSRAAATEFKKRLLKLIGNAANFIEIKTFHSFCFDLLGKVGNIKDSDSVLKKTIEKIQNKEVLANRITKTVLVIDEAQDMNKDEFNLVNTLIEQNEEMRVIMVGDDDQNIYGFRGANSKYLEQFIKDNKASVHELLENYRSKINLVDFTNQFVNSIKNRLKINPIYANQADNGKIKLVTYKSENLIIPTVRDILSTDLSGTVCVLTATNNEALQITGLLLNNGIQAKLIQSNESFKLSDLSEVRYFLNCLNLSDDVHIISDDVWAKAKNDLKDKFTRSSKLNACISLINDFEATSKKIYKSDLELYIDESKLEDFLYENGDTVFVSTIHKAKGKEFDNIFLMLDRSFNPTSDESKRQLYVAMTRAKQNLTIHTNLRLLDRISAENEEHLEDKNTYQPPSELSIQLTYEDVNLGYFKIKQHLISSLVSGDELTINGIDSLNVSDKAVVKFSKQFNKQIESMKENSYELIRAKINFILYWFEEETGKEVKIILPELYFKKNTAINQPKI